MREEREGTLDTIIFFLGFFLGLPVRALAALAVLVLGAILFPFEWAGVKELARNVWVGTTRL